MTTVPTRRRTSVVLGALLAASATLVGCGTSSDDESMAGSRTPPSAATDPTAEAHIDVEADTDAEADAGTETAAETDGASEDEAIRGASEPSRDLPDGIAEPVRVVIPAIGVDADLVDLDLQRPEPEVPSDFDQAGWYTATREPGEIGPAVLAGHIDSTSGPAVFSRLDELEEGDEVTVRGADGRTRTFAVTGSGQYPKDQLPPEVFGFGDAVPELRLITCGGSFDRQAGSYADNLVVYTQLVDA